MSDRIHFSLVLGLAALLGTAACAPGLAGGGAAGATPAPDAPRGSEAVVMMLDSNTRPATQPADVAVLTYVGEPQALYGCTLVARVDVTAGGADQMRAAAVPQAARIGATALVVAERETLRAENTASRAGLGAATTRIRYALNAYDCR